MYFHTDDNSMVSWLADVLDQARRHERSVRLDVDDKGALRVKIGAGGWTAPFDSTPDPYRDGPAIQKWFVNEDGEPYEYPVASQAEDFPNDLHTPFDTYGEAADWARRYRRRMNL